MTYEFRRSFDLLVVANRDSVEETITTAEETIFQLDLRILASSHQDQDFIGATPPRELLTGVLTTVEELATCIDLVDLRWRLDVVNALDEYLG